MDTPKHVQQMVLLIFNDNMKKILFTIISFFLIKAATLASSEEVTTNIIYQYFLQESNSAVNLTQILPKIEKLWSFDPDVYIRSVNYAVQVIYDRPETLEKKKVIFDLFESMMLKPCPTNYEKAIDWIRFKTETIQCSIKNSEIKNNKELWYKISKFAGEIHSKLILNYRNQYSELYSTIYGPGLEYYKDEAIAKNEENKKQDCFQRECRVSEKIIRNLLKHECPYYKPNSGDKFTEKLIAVSDLMDEKPAFDLRTIHWDIVPKNTNKTEKEY